MNKYNLLFENYEFDKKVIKAGNLYWFKFLEKAENDFSNKENIFLPSGYYYSRIFGKFNNDNLDIDVFAVFNSKEKAGSGYRGFASLGNSENGNVPIITIFLQNIINLSNFSLISNDSDSIMLKKDDFLTVLQSISVTNNFIHEFKHIIDSGNNLFDNKIYFKKDDNYEKYFNQTTELDAKTVELLNNIICNLMIKYGKSYNDLNKDEKFKYIKNELSKDPVFLRNYNRLNIDNRKKLLKRIYSFVDNVDDILPLE